MVIFIGTLIQKTNRFDQTPTSGKIDKLVSVYTILSDEKDLRESKEIPKFTKAKEWIPPVTSKVITRSKIPDSRVSP